jgi:hypothetical protein
MPPQLRRMSCTILRGARPQHPTFERPDPSGHPPARTAAPFVGRVLDCCRSVLGDPASNVKPPAADEPSERPPNAPCTALTTPAPPNPCPDQPLPPPRRPPTSGTTNVVPGWCWLLGGSSGFRRSGRGLDPFAGSCRPCPPTLPNRAQQRGEPIPLARRPRTHPVGDLLRGALDPLTLGLGHRRVPAASMARMSARA